VFHERCTCNHRPFAEREYNQRLWWHCNGAQQITCSTRVEENGQKKRSKGKSKGNEEHRLAKMQQLPKQAAKQLLSVGTKAARVARPTTTATTRIPYYAQGLPGTRNVHSETQGKETGKVGQGMSLHPWFIW
jgi:hypothetical protein